MKKRNGSSKMNAFKTGLYAREILLPWEFVAEFEEFCAKIFDYYKPKGTIEKHFGRRCCR